MPRVDMEVAIELPLVVAQEAVIAQISLLARTNATTVTAVLDRLRCLAARRVRRTLTRVSTFLRPLGQRLNDKPKTSDYNNKLIKRQ